jgi:polyisoprenoid-binding protein YceI
VTDVTATGERTADLRAELTVRGTTQPLPLSATVDHDGDTVRITAQTTVDRSAFGVSGNVVGMVPSTTTLIADLLFAKA